MSELTVIGIVTNAIQIGLKNVVSLLGAIVLWVLTAWIPYLNVGTTIGLIGLIVEMSKGNGFSPTEIFNPKYRKYMGEFFILMGLFYLGYFVGMMFVIIPGIVIAIAWGYAPFLFLEKEGAIDPFAAIRESNEMTYGKKWTIFGGMILLAIGSEIAIFIFGLIPYLRLILVPAGMIVMMAAMMGAQAYIYSVLKKK